jgi:hypothetical protein
MPTVRIVRHLVITIQIDGADAPLKTKWKVAPIAVLDRGHHIQSNGIAFAAFFTTEVIVWLLETLMDVCPSLSDIWKALISNENSAFIPALEMFRRNALLPDDFCLGFAHCIKTPIFSGN